MNDYKERHDSIINDLLADTNDDFSVTLKKFELALLNSEMTVDLIEMEFESLYVPRRGFKPYELMDKLNFLKDSETPENARYKIAIQLLAERVYSLNAYWKELQECAR